MSYVDLNKLNEDNIAGKDLTAAAMKAGGYTHVKGMGDIPIQLNKNGFAIAPADKLPDGVLDKLKGAWESSGHDVNKFFNTQVDGKSVQSIFQEMPSQQSYAVPAKLDGFPRGTSMPSAEWHDGGKTYSAIKYEGTNHLPTTPAPPPAPVTAPPAGPEKVGAIDGTYTGPHNDWWKFFVDPKFLMGAAAIAGIIALLKTLNNSIKIRFRKCAKVLYRMQKDFGGAEKGMDMRTVLPGVGSQIMDWIARRFGGKGKRFNDKKASGALGLRPFVDNYRNEIAADYQEARKAFNMIGAAGKGIDEKKGMEQNSGAMDTQPEAQNSSYKVVYTSFAEAIKSEPLNESEGETLNESVAAVVAIGSLALRGGMFLYNKIGKDGKPEGEAKPVQVTPQSTREICYSIMNLFFSKYFNMRAVSEKLGMNVEALGDIDASNVDKFTKIAEAMKTEQAASSTSKMFTRVHKNYTDMLNHYKNIANGVVKNFDVYTRKKQRAKGKDLGEKDSNLLLSANEKLKAEVERQIDGYENNFFRVANAIITSPEYTTYVDFIIKNVIPVFKSGLASDADYVLDVVPKEGEYYVVRQTNSQPEIEGGTAEGNVALVKITKFDNSGDKAKNPVVSFTRVAIMTDPGKLKRTDKYEYDLSYYPQSAIDRTAYSKKAGEEATDDVVSLPYNKWMALDPTLARNVNGLETRVYERPVTDEQGQVVKNEEGVEQKELLFVIPPKNETAASAFDEDIELNEDDAIDEETRRERRDRERRERKEAQKAAAAAKNAETPATNSTETSAEETPAETSATSTSEEKTPPVKNVLYVNKSNNNINIEIQADDTTMDAVDKVVKSSDNNMNFVEVPEDEAKKYVEQLQQRRQAAAKETVAKAENIPDIVNKKEQGPVKPEDTAKIIETVTADQNMNAVAKAIADKVSEISKFVNTEVNRQTTAKSNPASAIQNVFHMSKYFTTFGTQQGSNAGIVQGAKYTGDGTVPVGDTRYLAFNLNQPLSKNEELVLLASLNFRQSGQNNENIASYLEYGLGVKTNDTYVLIGTYGTAVEASYQAAVNGANNIINVVNPKDFLVEKGEEILSGYLKKKAESQAQPAAQQSVQQTAQQPVQQTAGQPTQTASGEQNWTSTNSGNAQPAQPDNQSFNITYSDMFNLAESFMGTLSYLNVHRFIKPEQKTKEQYYVLSENAWGDGVTVNPVAKLNEFIKNTFATCGTYDDFTRLAKSSVSINFMPVNEDCSYKTILPYNRYQMLTESNPLYEATVILSFDQFGAVSNIIDKGVTKICK